MGTVTEVTDRRFQSPTPTLASEAASRRAFQPLVNHIMLVGKAAGHGIFKGAALVGAFVIIVAAWLWDASLLTAAADKNLQLIKTITGVLPFDWESKVESALRIFGADRALLLIEGVVIAKVIMLSIAYPFRHRRPYENVPGRRNRYFANSLYGTCSEVPRGVNAGLTTMAFTNPRRQPGSPVVHR
jgi:hypothetical protein